MEANREPLFASNRVRIVVVEDHEIARYGLIKLLADHADRFNVVGQTGRGMEAIELCQRLKPDILILDLKLPGDITGYEVIRTIRALKLPVKILVLTSDPLAHNSLVGDQAVEGYILKSESNSEIIVALEKVYADGFVTANNSPSRYFFSSSYENGAANPVEDVIHRPLTSREKEVLQATARGLTRVEIAEKLGVTEGTVGLHQVNLYRKLGVRNKAEAVNYAHRNGLLDGDGGSYSFS
jgi:DNA-binding NarL/FixJ family response regulator